MTRDGGWEVRPFAGQDRALLRSNRNGHNTPAEFTHVKRVGFSVKRHRCWAGQTVSEDSRLTVRSRKAQQKPRPRERRQDYVSRGVLQHQIFRMAAIANRQNADGGPEPRDKHDIISGLWINLLHG